MGADLFCTVWATIEQMLKSCRHEILFNGEAELKGYGPFLETILSDSNTLLRDSLLTGAGDEDGVDVESALLDDWQLALIGMGGLPTYKLEALALEAKKQCRRLEARAKAESSRAFEEAIDESLKQRDGMLHRFVKDEARPTAVILSELTIQASSEAGIVQACENIDKIDGVMKTRIEGRTATVYLRDDLYRSEIQKWDGRRMDDGSIITVDSNPTRFTTDPMRILEVHSKVWGKHEGVGNETAVEDSRAVINGMLTMDLDDDDTAYRNFSPDDIRKAARKFKNRTAIGADLWSFTDLEAMPDLVLADLAVILAKTRHDGIPPAQCLNNHMATLPKKNGGVRTVVIMTTLYHLLMEMDHDDFSDRLRRRRYHMMMTPRCRSE